jgi:hypothetical protein
MPKIDPMKKTFKLIQLIFLFVSVHIFSFAQITITKNDMPSANDNFLLRNANSTSQDDFQLSGSNQTWNFTHLLPTDSQTIECLPIIGAGPIIVYFFSFPTATYATKGNDLPLPDVSPITVTNLYNFYKVSNASFSILGFGASISGIPTPIEYDTVDVVYNFPMNFGDSHINRSQFTINIPTVGSLIESRRRTTTVDGWGTLKLPNGMDYQVLKVKSVSEITDNLSIEAIPFPIPPIPRNETEYKWLAADSGVPLLQINTTSFTGAETVSSIAFKYTPDLSGLNDQSSSTLLVYPNPASHNISVVGNSSQIQIVDLLGNIVYQQNVSSTKEINSIDISDLANGIYWIKSSIKNETSIQKVILNK